VVPQKVVLAWGHDAPVGLVRHDILGRTTWSVNQEASEPPFAPPVGDAASFEIYKSAVLARAQQYFSLAGVEGIVFTAGEPEAGAINLYFMPPTASATGLGGLAYTGIDRLNLEADGEAFIVVRGFDPADPLDVEEEAETVAHEIGHLLGLPHIDPPGALEIMDYDRPPGDVEEFTNGIFPITEPPRAGGTVYPDLHNPVYHLRRYVDGVPHEELVDGQTIPGTWDLPSPVLGDLQTSFAFASTADPMDETLLYDVMVFETLAGDPSEGVRVLAEFPEISLSELAEESFLVSGGEGIGLFAASAADQSHDVALAPGDPFLAQAFVLYPGWGELEGFLQVEAATPAGFETLATVMLQILNDLLVGDYNNNGTVEQGDLDLVLLNWGNPATPAPDGWISSLPAGTIDQAELDGVLLHWGNSAGQVGRAGAVPEPATILTALVAALGMARRRIVKRIPANPRSTHAA
jgi:hypothetical protein